MHLVTEPTGDEYKIESSSPEFFTVDLNSVALVWPTLEPWVAKALSKFGGDFRSGSVLKQVVNDDLKLWVGMLDGDVVAGLFWRLKETNRGSKIWLELVVGRDSHLWTETLVQHIRKIVTLTEAYAVEGACRPGLARLLERQGLSKPYAVMMRMT